MSALQIDRSHPRKNMQWPVDWAMHPLDRDRAAAFREYKCDHLPPWKEDDALYTSLC